MDNTIILVCAKSLQKTLVFWDFLYFFNKKVFAFFFLSCMERKRTYDWHNSTTGAG